MKIAALQIVFAMVSLSLNAQYYYDRSKNPDRNIKNLPQQKATRDFDRYYFFSWDANKPMSNTDFINQTSSLGTKLGFRKRLNDVDRLWVGGDFGWAVYKQYIPYQTYVLSQTQSLSTDLYDYTYALNIAATIDYFFLPTDKLITPYGGFGIGAAYDKFTQYFNVYGGSATSWGLLLRPEVGVLIGFKENSSWRIKVAAHYDYSTNTSTDFGYKNFTNSGFQVGIVKMAW
jgi:hypothetical protein